MVVYCWSTENKASYEPMNHLERLLDDNGERWGSDKLKVVAICREDPTTAIKKQGWELVEQYSSFQSDSWDYDTETESRLVIIDQSGTIAAVGHPSRRPVDKDIEMIIRGEAL